MNRELIGELIALRYKLLWAKTRSRGGKIALLVIAYVILMLALLLLGAGGFGAGIQAVRAGKAELVAQIVLSTLFLQTTLSTVVLGFGIAAAFSEAELRRYPLTAWERRAARHITGILDPFWFLVLALDLGLVVGLYAMGATSIWVGLAAVLLLLVANYLLARVVSLTVEKLIRKKGGAVILMLVVVGMSMVPGTLAAALRNEPGIGKRILNALSWTPPFGAAAMMTADTLRALLGFSVVLWWIFGLALLVVRLERRPPERRQAIAKGPIAWDSGYERVGGLFGAENAPLVGHWLRFYMRNTRFKTLCLLTLPVAGFLTYQMGTQGKHAAGFFAGALGAFPMCGFLATSRIAVNLFGYTGGAFRRFFLLPARPAACLRAASYASVLLGACMVVVATIAWLVLAPVPFDARMLVMLVAMGVFGLFGLHAAGLWTTLYNPRRGNYNANIGNDMSIGGNLVVIGGILAPLFGMQIVAHQNPALVSPDNWWAAVALAAAAVMFYIISLRAAESLFPSRREKLMAVVEGRS